jgi:hypothetical protein
MKNQLIKRSYDGTIEGDAVISARTLDDVLSTGRSPLAFPVIDAHRSIAVSNTNFEEFIPGVSFINNGVINDKYKAYDQ